MACRDWFVWCLCCVLLLCSSFVGCAGEDVSVTRESLISPVQISAVHARRGGVSRASMDTGGSDVRWQPAALMTQPRSGHTATVLPDGNVLVVGGVDGGALASAELFDRLTGRWRATASMNVARHGHTATMLPNGRVLVAGGEQFPLLPIAEVYDPDTETWETVGQMTVTRINHIAVWLPDSGTVMVTGGYEGNFGVRSSAEVYDPATKMWLAVAPMSLARQYHTAVWLPEVSRVLVIGGLSNSNVSLEFAELYDPVTNFWTPAASMKQARYQHTTTRLPSGDILVAGRTANAELYDPLTNTWECAGTTTSPTCEGVMNHGRYAMSATWVSVAGRVLVAGGWQGTFRAYTEWYDPATKTWTVTDGLLSGRAGHTSTLLSGMHLPGTAEPSDYVLVAGGYTISSTLATSELFDPGALGAVCSTSDECLSGMCVDGVCCDSACDGGDCDACSVLFGASINGVCELLSNTPCDDGDYCTTQDTCQAGICTEGEPVVCHASDPCRLPGICDSATGLCTNPAVPNRTPCDDNNVCTQTDVCIAGECMGYDSVECTPVDDCHQAGVCDPASGICSSPVRPDGASCDDGMLCSQDDVCIAGVCVGGPPVACPPVHSCQEHGVCNPETGGCHYDLKPNGSFCDDDSACTNNDTCMFGLCVGETAVVCDALDSCHQPGACDPQTGLCSNPVKADGEACDDSNACTTGDTCQRGVCVAGGLETCEPTSPCRESGVCSPESGCTEVDKPDGTVCDDGDRCTIADTCMEGGCRGTDVVCESLNECLESVCDVATGECVEVAILDHTECSNGRCESGVCSPVDTLGGGGCDCDVSAGQRPHRAPWIVLLLVVFAWSARQRRIGLHRPCSR